mmetsp:Transcript_91285/g.263415  ORF Transcript_91285/g.263415 Transcript_91285/m.263415 type:complete len:208 (+) Transcript_91285:188-811(+)
MRFALRVGDAPLPIDVEGAVDAGTSRLREALLHDLPRLPHTDEVDLLLCLLAQQRLRQRPNTLRYKREVNHQDGREAIGKDRAQCLTELLNTVWVEAQARCEAIHVRDKHDVPVALGLAELHRRLEGEQDLRRDLAKRHPLASGTNVHRRALLQISPDHADIAMHVACQHGEQLAVADSALDGLHELADRCLVIPLQRTEHAQAAIL